MRPLFVEATPFHLQGPLSSPLRWGPYSLRRLLRERKDMLKVGI